MKKNIYWISILIGFSLGLFYQLSLLQILSYPMGLYMELIRTLSLSSSLGNILAWLFIISLSYIPLLVILKIKREKFQIALYSFIGLLLVLSIYKHFNPSNTNFPNDLSLFVINSLYLATLFGLLYEAKIRDSKNHSEILHILIIATIILLSRNFPIYLSQVHEISVISLMNLAVECFLLVHLLHLLYLIDQFLWDRDFNLLSDNSISKLQKIDKYAHKMLSYSIYATILLNAFKFLMLDDSVHFNFNFPAMELLFTSIIALFMHLILQAVSVKKENEQFI